MINAKWLAPWMALCFLGAVPADNPPPMKEGLWEIHTRTVDIPSKQTTERVEKLCRSHAYDDYTHAAAQKRESNCKTVSKSTTSSVTTTETDCTVGSTTIRTKGILTMTGDTAARTEGTATYTPPIGGKTGMTLVSEQKYVGPCPADMQPGDAIDPDGKKTNHWKH
jgi:hypothetical protein